MIKIRYIPCQRALSPTGIKIADYVINPYRGCEYGCAYCYAQRNKCFQRREEEWGQFIDIKENILDILKYELNKLRGINRVMLGSTTEVYQPLEAEEQITGRVLEVLNEYNIPVTILTKSDLIRRDKDLLKSHPGNKICFTINSKEVIQVFEKGTPDLETRLKIIYELNEEGISTYAHIGPCFPYLTKPEELLPLCLGKTIRVNIESLNLTMIDQEKIIATASTFFPEAAQGLKALTLDQRLYQEYWVRMKHEIEQENKKYNYKMNILVHSFNSYWG